MEKYRNLGVLHWSSNLPLGPCADSSPFYVGDRWGLRILQMRPPSTYLGVTARQQRTEAGARVIWQTCGWHCASD